MYRGWATGREMAHWFPYLDETELGHLGLFVSNGEVLFYLNPWLLEMKTDNRLPSDYSRVSLFCLDLDEYMVREPVPEGAPHLHLAFILEFRHATCIRCYEGMA